MTNPKRPGRPRLDPADRKQQISLRLAPDIVAAIREAGAARVEAALRAVLLA